MFLSTAYFALQKTKNLCGINNKLTQINKQIMKRNFYFNQSYNLFFLHDCLLEISQGLPTGFEFI